MVAIDSTGILNKEHNVASNFIVIECPRGVSFCALTRILASTYHGLDLIAKYTA